MVDCIYSDIFNSIICMFGNLLRHVHWNEWTDYVVGPKQVHHFKRSQHYSHEKVQYPQKLSLEFVEELREVCVSSNNSWVNTATVENKDSTYNPSSKSQNINKFQEPFRIMTIILSYHLIYLISSCRYQKEITQIVKQKR